jgi:hypothetical protein
MLGEVSLKIGYFGVDVYNVPDENYHFGPPFSDRAVFYP